MVQEALSSDMAEWACLLMLAYAHMGHGGYFTHSMSCSRCPPYSPESPVAPHYWKLGPETAVPTQDSP